METDVADPFDTPVLELSNQLNLHLVDSEAYLKQLYRLSKGLNEQDHKPAHSFIQAHPDFCSKLQKRFPDSLLGFNYDKGSANAARSLQLQAEAIIHSLHEAYEMFQTVAFQQNQAIELLADLHKVLSELSVNKSTVLLHAYMQLFTNTARISLLLAACPRKLIMQLYSAAYAMAYNVEPPLRKDICDFLAEVDSVVPALQKQVAVFAPRIMQVMELVVAPVLDSLSVCTNISLSGILDVQQAATQQLGVAGMSREVSLKYLQNIEEVRSWAYFAFITCPECVTVKGGAKLLGVLLRDTFRFQVYRDHYEWLHPLCEQHVKPALLRAYTQMKAAGQLDKEAQLELKRQFKNLVAEASNEACNGSCVKEHLSRRVFVTQQLQKMWLWFQDAAEELPNHLPVVFAALAYGSSEVLWYFRHMNEQLPKGFPANPNIQPLKESEPDFTIVQLLTAMQQLYELLLVDSRDAIQEHWVQQAEELLGGVVAPQTQTVRCSLSAIPGQAFAAGPLGYMMKALRSILQRVKGGPIMDEPSIDGDDNDSTLLEAVQVKEVQAVWMALQLALSNTRATLRDEELTKMANDPRYLTNVQQLLEVMEQVENVVAAVDQHCQLQDVAFFNDKLEALTNSLLRTPGAPVPLCPALLKVLNWYEYCTDVACTSTDYSQIAEQQSDKFFRAVNERIWSLTMNCIKGVSPSGGNTPADGAAAATTNVTQMTRTWQATRKLLVSGQDVGSQAPDEQLLELAALLRSLEMAGSVKVNRRCHVVPIEYAREALQQFFHDHISRASMFGGNIKVPSQLAAEVSGFLHLMGYLQNSLTSNFQVNMWEAMLGQTWGCLPGQPFTAPGLPNVMSHVAEWYLEMVVKDSKGWGVMFAPQRRAFVALHQQAPDLTLYTGVEELAALIQVFGPYAACEIGKKLLQPIADCIAVLDGQLVLQQPVLEPILNAYQETGSCMEECTRALSSLPSDMAPLVATIKVLGRCLALRQLLAEATALALQSRSSTLVSAAAVVDGEDGRGPVGLLPGESVRDVCDVLQLPRPGCDDDCSPATADPVLVELLSDNNSVERHTRWSRLPALLALLLTSPAWGPSTPPHYHPPTRTLSNELHTLTASLKALVLAHVEATRKLHASGPKTNTGQAALAAYKAKGGALPSGRGGVDQLQGNVASQVQQTLACFCEIAAVLIHQGGSIGTEGKSSALGTGLGTGKPGTLGTGAANPAVVREARQLVLRTVIGRHLDRSDLEDAFVPAIKLWSAVKAEAVRAAA